MSVQAPERLTEPAGGADVPVAVAAGNWQLTWRRLRRNRAALVAGIVFLFVVLACYPGASLWVHFVSHRGPDVQNIQGTIGSGADRQPVVRADGTPIGPGLRGAYLLGADANGRDLFVRVLYGGRTSLTVGLISALVCTLLALLVALPAGFFGGWVDRAASRLMDLIWSFPVYLLAVSLAAALVSGGVDLGPIHIGSSSLVIPIVVIAVVFVPYVGRPVRGEVLALRNQEFVEASIAHGGGPGRVMFREILPNVVPTTLVLFTLIVANNILVEAALSFLGVGVSVLTPSWGNIIEQGFSTIVTAPWQTIAPGLAIMLTAISLNVLGDGLRDALDPHGRLRGIV